MGHLPAYMRDRLAFFSACGNGSGPIVRCRLAGDGYLLNEPEDIHHVLVRNQANYVKARRVTGPRARYPVPWSLLTSAGEDHRRKRIAIQPIFRRALVERIEGRAAVNAQRLAASWPDRAEIELAPAMRRLAQRNILEVLFGVEPALGLDAIGAASAARRRSIERVLFSVFPLPEYLPSRINLGYVSATRRLARVIAAEIAARRSGRPAAGEDILSQLMAVRFEDGSALSDAELRDEALTFSLTGYDSVSEALAWTLHLAARHPEAVAPGGGHRDLTAVVRESLRLYPPTWLFARLALGDDPLPSGEVLPAGAKVYLCPWVVHRNPRHWPDPERFDPDRFAPGVAEGRPRYAYFPFGGGSHVCIAETLSLAQVVTVLATVTAGHRIAPAGRAPAPVGGLTLSPGPGLRVRVERR